MSIPVDQYTTAVGGPFLSQAYGNLEGIDIFFFVSVTNELRFKQLVDSNVQSLVSGAQRVTVIQGGDILHVYYSDLDRAVHYIPFTIQSLTQPVTPIALGMGSAVSFSAIHAPNSNPSVYAMVVEDTRFHTLYTSLTPDFTSIKGRAQVYTNTTDTAHYTGFPVMAIHSDDTDVVTIHCQQTTKSTGATSVGFYTAKLPGVV